MQEEIYGALSNTEKLLAKNMLLVNIKGALSVRPDNFAALFGYFNFVSCRIF